MENPQRLPVRTVRFDTHDPDALAAVQPERRRRYEQIARGRFRGSMAEHAFGRAALLHEGWSCGMRVRCDRPSGYTAFAVPRPAPGDASWCGEPLAPDAVLRVDGPWELSTSGAFEFIAFAVDAAALSHTADLLAGGERPGPQGENRVLAGIDAEMLAGRLLRRLRALGRDAEPRRGVPDTIAEDLLHLAATIDRAGGGRPEDRSASPSQRRAAVARVEEYLDAHRSETPSIPTLCGVAGVSERTLEYAFREHLGMTPVRYLKVRRLNQVQRALRAAEPGRDTVTNVALRWGFFDLGRFAGEYGALFGERPSETLARATAGRRARACGFPTAGTRAPR